uniref:HAT C-terminal dimerisation domain-containing protein n=1 Tax=Amphimedon queenslandica TaxID=400682 RepID=A0A1X7VAT2_AMPQE
MVVKDLRPSSIVESEGFKDLLEVLDPRYTIVSRQYLQYSLIPKQVSETVAKIKLSLQDTRFCSVTLDIWSSRRMHAYLGVACHILINWEIVSYLLACRQIFGAHTGENILADFKDIAGDFQIKPKIFKAITDNASNMKKAFQPISLPGFVLVDSDESEDEDDDSESLGISIEECEEQDQLDVLDNLERISCFAHTLQLCIKDGITASRQVTKAIAKVAHIVNHVKKSTKATEKLESLFKKTLISKNETRWNSQLKMV